MTTVGVIGLGVVGGTVVGALEAVGVSVRGYDPYVGVGEPGRLAAAEVVFVCVPTPASDDGGLDTTAVWKAVREIEPHLQDATIVAVKSTVPPGTSDELAEEFPRLEFASVPEFLVAARPKDTFVQADRMVIGTRTWAAADLLGRVLRLAVPHAPFVFVSPIEGELVKLCSNAMLASKVSLANELALICEAFGVGWERVQDGVGLDARIGPGHLTVTPERGFSGGCLPKDFDGLIAASISAGYVPSVLQEIASFNERVRDGAPPDDEGARARPDPPTGPRPG